MIYGSGHHPKSWSFYLFWVRDGDSLNERQSPYPFVCRLIYFLDTTLSYSWSNPDSCLVAPTCLLPVNAVGLPSYHNPLWRTPFTTNSTKYLLLCVNPLLPSFSLRFVSLVVRRKRRHKKIKDTDTLRNDFYMRSAEPISFLWERSRAVWGLPT